MANKESKRERSQRWTADEAGGILDEIESLGVTDVAFARQHNLKCGRISWWRQRLDRPRRIRGLNRQERSLAPASEAAGFVEVRMPPALTADTRIEVMLRNGRSVRIGVDVPVEAVAILLDTVEGKTC